MGSSVQEPAELSADSFKRYIIRKIQWSELGARMFKPTYTVSYGKSSLGRPRGLVNGIKMNRR
jgi:hypothetical protein